MHAPRGTAGRRRVEQPFPIALSRDSETERIAWRSEHVKRERSVEIGNRLGRTVEGPVARDMPLQQQLDLAVLGGLPALVLHVTGHPEW